MICRAREVAGLPLQVGEHAVAALAAKPSELLVEESFVVHAPLQLAAGVGCGLPADLRYLGSLLRSKKACLIRSSSFCRAVSRDPVCGF